MMLLKTRFTTVEFSLPWAGGGGPSIRLPWAGKGYGKVRVERLDCVLTMKQFSKSSLRNT